MRSNDRIFAGIVGLFAGWALLGLAIAALGPVLIGWSPHVVTSGSMTPAMRRGDVVLTDWVDGHHLRRGDIALFDTGDGPTVHRIVDVLPDGRYRTRGEANRAADSTPVAPNEIRGKVRMVVPFVGRLFLLPHESPPFQVVAIVTLALIVCTTRVGLERRREMARFA